MGIYVVVARARASAIFGLGDSFSVPVQFPGREPFTLTFQTTYGTGFEVPFPKDFYVDARGAAKERSEAVELFINTALGVTSMIALITNAYMGHLEPELIFDATPELGEHEYVQSFVADLPITTVPGRRIDMDVLRATIEAWNTHPRKDRLLRATVQYVEALRSWRPGYEITCLAHLYMGVEAATKAVLSEHLHKSGLSKDEIQDQWKVDRKEFDNEVRRRLIFRGDITSFKKAKEVSDGFEHGYSDFAEMRKPAGEVIVKTAGYLRRAILETIGIEQALLERALGPKYQEARGPLNVIRYIHGTLVGKPEQLAAENEPYPIMEWRTSIKSVAINSDGTYGYVPNDTFTPKLGDGVQFRPTRFEIWDGSVIKEQPREIFEQHDNNVSRPDTEQPQTAFLRVLPSGSPTPWGTVLADGRGPFHLDPTEVRSPPEGQFAPPYGGLVVNPHGVMRARSVAGALMMNFASVELFTIVLLRLLMPTSQKRSDLIRGELAQRLDAIIRRLPRARVFDAEAKKKLREALKTTKAMLKARDIVAYDPYLNIQGEWVWAQVRDAEPDFRRITSVSLDRIAAVNDHLVAVAQEIEQLLAPHIGPALSGAQAAYDGQPQLTSEQVDPRRKRRPT